MVLDFSWLPPEINSTRIFSGAGSGPLFVAASAWDGLASDLSASASSFNSVISGLTNGQWMGPASASMAAAALPYVGWLSAASAQAEAAASQARAAASAFESALAATVPPAAVAANRSQLLALIATNILGQNTPAIAATEFEYMEMWAQDVGAMLGYHAGATSAASALPAFALPPVNLSGLSGLTSTVTSVTSALSATSAGGLLSSGASTALSAVEGAGSSVLASVEASPLSTVASVGQIGMYPASMMMSPLMMLAQTGTHAAPLTGAELASDVPKSVGALPGAKAFGGGLGGAGMGADLGKARLVGAMSVPPTWQGSTPARMGSAAMSGLGGAMPNAAAGGPMGGMQPMPMPMGMGGAGAGMGGPLGRGGASPHVTQNRPSVIPRTGVG
jgi:PPE-repeat protein